jgi:adenosylcobinamide-phosphate synthase
VFVPRSCDRAAGIAVGFLADLLLGDPRRGHPVAGFGTGAARLEKLIYADNRAAGVLHTGLLLGGLGLLGVAAGQRAWVTAVATYVALGGTSLNRVGGQMATLLQSGDLDGARALLPSLCGRDPAALDTSGLTRATVESLAENTSDAQVAPLFWAAIGGVPGVLVYRGANTLDAMIGHRSPRYARFGWAAARFDDVLNYLPARLTGVLAVVCAPVVGGSPRAAMRAWHRDAARHPSPNAGVAEASFAGALGVRLGGPTQYAHQLEIRPTLGDGRIPEVADVARAVRLSRAVQACAAAVSVLLAVSVSRSAPGAFSGAFRSGRRSSLRW